MTAKTLTCTQCAMQSTHMISPASGSLTARIMDYHGLGISGHEVAKAVGRSASLVYKVWRASELHNVRCPACGAPISVAA